MADLIKTIKILENYEPFARRFHGITVDGGVILDVLELLKEQSEIVHCKNCKWFSEKGFCKHPDGGAGNIRPATWFCGDGKRREVE